MNVNIRATTVEDAEGLRQLYNQPNVLSGTLQLPFTSIATWKQRLTTMPEEVVSLVADHQQHIIGNISLQRLKGRRSHVGYLGIAVHDEYQGKGLGTRLTETLLNYCDQWTHIKRIELTVFVDNELAIRLYKKFGFEVEGRGKAYALRSGELVDVYFMARVQS